MINGLPLLQLLQGPVNTEGNASGTTTAGSGTTEFAGLLGGILGENAPAILGQASQGSSSLTANLPSDLQAALRSLILGNIQSQSAAAKGSQPTVSGEPLAGLLDLLNQLTGGQFVPLNISIDDAELAEGQAGGLGKAAGLDGSAVVLVREADIRQLLDSAASGDSGISLPVLTLLAGNSGSGSPFSLIPSTLTVKLPSDNGGAAAGTDKFAGMELQLTFALPDSGSESFAPDSGITPDYSLTADKLIQASSRLIALLGSSSSQANDAGGAAGAGSAGALEKTGALLNAAENNYADPGQGISPAEVFSNLSPDLPKIAWVRESVKSLLANLEGIQAGDSLPAEAKITGQADSALEQGTLQMLTGILGRALELALGGQDSGEVENTLTLLNRLARFEHLSNTDQKKTLECLLQAIDRLADSAPAPGSGNPLTLAEGNPALQPDLSAAPDDKPAGSVSPGRNSQPQISIPNPPVTDSHNSTGSTGNAAATVPLSAGLTAGLTGAAGKTGESISLADQPPVDNESVLPSRLTDETKGSNPVPEGAAARDPRVQALSEAAKSIMSLVSSVIADGGKGNDAEAVDQKSTAASAAPALHASTDIRTADPRTLENRSAYQPVPAQNATPAGEKVVIPQGPPVAASYTAPDTAKVSSPVPESNTTDNNYQDTKRDGQNKIFTADDKSSPDSTGGNNLTKTAGRISGALLPTDISTGSAADSAGKIAVEGSKITVQVKLAPEEARKLEGHPSGKQAAVEYVKVGGDNSGSPEKETPGALRNITGGGLEDLLESWLKQNSGREEQAGKTGSADPAAGLKNEQFQTSLRNEMNPLHGADQKTDQPQAPRSNWLANQAEAFDKIINAARLARAGGSSEISLRLEPENLGMMRVRLSLDNNQALSARIQVETQEARSLIEGSLNRLKESLAQQGLKVEKFSVDVRQDQHHEQNPYQTAAGRDGGHHFRSRGGYFSSRSGEPFAAARAESDSAGVKAGTLLNKYAYSTLEWVA